MKLRIGLVGLGEAWESRHRPALRALGDRFEVRAVCAEVSHWAQRAAQDFHAVAVDGFRALAARDDIDAVLVLSPDWYGPLPILAASELGKAVYCVDALELDSRLAREIKRRVDESGVAFMAEFPRRLAPATLRLKELIATHLGPPRLLFCHTRQSIDGQVPGMKRETPPSGLSNRNLLEQIDWCRYVVGSEPTAVQGVRHVNCTGDDDYQMMSVDFSPLDRPGTGALAQISSGRYMPSAWPEAISYRPPAALQVSCERGVAFIDLPATLVWFDAAGRHLESLDSERPVGEQLLMIFHRAVTSLVRKISDLEDSYRALAILQAARHSMAEGRRITLDFS
jgi:predicted dehydrogenase